MFSLEHIIQIVLKYYYKYVLGNFRFQKIELGSKINRIFLPFCSKQHCSWEESIFWSWTMASVLRRFMATKSLHCIQMPEESILLLLCPKILNYEKWNWAMVPNFWNLWFPDTFSIGDIKVKLLQCGSSLLFLDFCLSLDASRLLFVILIFSILLYLYKNNWN